MMSVLPRVAVVLWATLWWCGWLPAVARAQADGSFWWLTNPATTTTTTTSTAAPASGCQCVPYYLCLDGEINTSGAGVIDIRLGNSQPAVSNVDECPELLEVCCGTSSTTPAPPTTTTLPPDTPCDCTPFTECPAERLVSDGSGVTTIEILGTGYSHSKCDKAFTVCCALEPTTEPLETGNCVCVEPHLCGNDGYVVTDGVGIINVRVNTFSATSPLVSGKCSNDSAVCCQVPRGATTTATTTEEPQASCGRRNYGGVRARILGFREGESQYGEFPWVAAVLEASQAGPFTPTSLNFVGGGTLIHPRVVLTAAHKVYGRDSSDLVVRVGEWDTQGDTEPYPHQDLAVSRALLHPAFNPGTLYNDVALLFLEDEVVLGPHINTLCLAEDVSQFNHSACVINGWGVNAFEKGEYQEIMKSLELPFVDSATCQNSLRGTRLGRGFVLDNSFLCAGGEKGKDACKGDGGGPLACPSLEGPSGHYLLVGITAWGIGCGREGIPGVYASIPALLPWITNALEADNIAGADVTQAGGSGGGGRRNQAERQQRREERQRRKEERQRRRQERQRQRSQRRQGK